MADCFGSLHVVAMRATRLAADGSPVGGATGSYVSSHLMRVALNPDVEEGEEVLQKNGAGCICLTYQPPDYVKRWQLELDNCRLEPALFEMLFGAELIPGAGDAILGGVLPSGAQGCDVEAAGVGFEFWTRAWDGDAPLQGFPYIRWVVPKSIWAFGDNEFGAEALTVTLTGRTENNPQFGDPYDDQPTGYVNTAGQVAYFLDTAIPEAACEYQELDVS